MSLLWMDYETEFQNLVDVAHRYEREENPEYFSALSSAVHKIIYRDTKYNIDFLYTSYVCHDEKIMYNYAIWLFQLMASVLKNRTISETADYVIRHLDYIRRAFINTVSMEKQETLLHLLNLAQEAIRTQIPADEKAAAQKVLPFQPVPSSYEAEIQQYMQSLFDKDMRKTLSLIQEFTERGLPVTTIYVDILAESMRRVGELWHTARITVDTEHYCTSVTQMAMAQMYPLIFEGERNQKSVLCACPGTELHEMGARMVADLFENAGWDSIFLGAAVPESAMMEAIRTNQPDLVALSVTMPQHLITCQELVAAIRRDFPNLKIAVGGGAFSNTNQIWSQWPIDYYTTDARELLKIADREICI